MGDEQKENKVKLILVGQPRTGKTAIYNRLLTNTYDANSMSSQTPKNQTKVVSLDTGDVEIDVKQDGEVLGTIDVTTIIA